MSVIPDWNESIRRDGLVIRNLTMDTERPRWMILARDDGPALDRCPCCNQPILSVVTARAIADHEYPLK